jgi:magnesium transporter
MNDSESNTVRQIKTLAPPEAAEQLSHLPVDESAEIAGSLDPVASARILAEMHPQVAATLLARVEPLRASRMLAAMRPDDRVDVLEQLPPPLHEQFVRGLTPFEADEVRRLEQYPPDTAGGIMTTEVTALPDHLTADQAIAELRRRRREENQVYYVYTVDGDGRLTGVLSMRDLILSDADTKLAAIVRKALAVDAGTDQEEVARQLRKHGYLALPVVDAERRVLGLITADDVADVVEEEATEDIQKLGGTEALDAPYLKGLCAIAITACATRSSSP